jgi:hypothetical protein
MVPRMSKFGSVDNWDNHRANRRIYPGRSAHLSTANKRDLTGTEIDTSGLANRTPRPVGPSGRLPLRHARPFASHDPSPSHNLSRPRTNNSDGTSLVLEEQRWDIAVLTAQDSHCPRTPGAFSDGAEPGVNQARNRARNQARKEPYRNGHSSSTPVSTPGFRDRGWLSAVILNAEQLSSSRVGPEQAAQRCRGASQMLAHRPAQMRLISEAEVGGEIGQARLAICHTVERPAHAHADAVPGQRHPQLARECPAQPVRRDAEQVRERQQSLGGRIPVRDRVAGGRHK